MALVAAKCTQCGAGLEVDPIKDAAICPFCHTAFITEKAINNYNTTNVTNIETLNADVVNIMDNKADNLYRSGEACLKLGNYIKACETFETMINDYPFDYRGYYGILRSITCDLTKTPLVLWHGKANDTKAAFEGRYYASYQGEEYEKRMKLYRDALGAEGYLSGYVQTYFMCKRNGFIEPPQEWRFGKDDGKIHTAFHNFSGAQNMYTYEIVYSQMIKIVGDDESSQADLLKAKNFFITLVQHYINHYESCIAKCRKKIEQFTAALAALPKQSEKAELSDLPKQSEKKEKHRSIFNIRKKNKPIPPSPPSSPDPETEIKDRIKREEDYIKSYDIDIRILQSLLEVVRNAV